MSGPLGPLPGMAWDSATNRYYVIPKSTPNQVIAGPSRPTSSTSMRRQASSSSHLPLTECAEDRKRPGKKLRLSDGNDKGYRIRRPAARGRMTSIRRVQDDWQSSTHTHLSSMKWDERVNCGGCHGEVVTSVQSFPNGGIRATTDHGRLVMFHPDGSMRIASVCSQPLVGSHMDLARMSTITVAVGPEAHVHHFRRDPESIDQFDHTEMAVPYGEVNAMSTFDGQTILGGEKGFSVFDWTTLRPRFRRMQSDVLAVDMFESSLAFTGLRNGSVVLRDLRTPAPQPFSVQTTKGKAVIHVKKLKDSAVAWGLAVSGMMDELLIFDARFGKHPLHTLNGHVNNYHRQLGMTTTPDHSYIFHAGSDMRIRAWSTLTGDRLMPVPPMDIDDTPTVWSDKVYQFPPPPRHLRTPPPGPGGDMSRILDMGDDSDYDEYSSPAFLHDDVEASEISSIRSSVRTGSLTQFGGANEVGEEIDDDEEDELFEDHIPPSRGNQVGRSDRRHHRSHAAPNPTELAVAVPAFADRVETNPLRRHYPMRVTSLSFREDTMGLDVAVRGEIQRFA